MRQLMSILIAALAVAVATPANAQTAPVAKDGVTTTFTAQQQKKNVAPVRAAPQVRAVSRPAAPMRAVSRPAAPVRSVVRPTTPTRSVVSKPTTHVVTKPVVTTAKPTKPVVTTTVKSTKPVVTTTVKSTKPVVTTVKPTKPTVMTTTKQTTPGLTQVPGTKHVITQTPGTKHVITQGPGKTRVITQGPGKLGNRVVRDHTNRDNLRGLDRGQRHVAINRDRRRMFVNNRWRTLVPLIALGTFAVGAETFYADGYVSLPEPGCVGYAEDGSRLRWMAVPTEDGDAEYQCVAYNPQRGRTVTEITVPEEQVVEEPAPVAPPETTGLGPAREQEAVAPEAPPAPATGCELLIYSETNFKGLSAPVDENQPTLGDNGWQNEIASLQIKSGTWDFYSDEDYGGELMRLGVGTYPTLDPKWSKHIGSFMCSAPSK